MDKKKMIAEMERSQSIAPTSGLHLPSFAEKLKARLELPDQFLRAMTLREGTWIIVFCLNLVAALLTGFLLTCMFLWKEGTDEWWRERFRDDFDYYHMSENQKLIEELWPYWEPITWGIIGTKTGYFVTGLMVMYALVKKTVTPLWYLPWLMMTAFLVTTLWLIGGAMIVAIFILLQYRPITVTWDLVPICCVIAYNYAWTYCFFVVVAHYKRRWIVKFWRDKGFKIGVDVVPSLEKKLSAAPF